MKTMKYISAAALLLAMAACSNDEDFNSAYMNDPDAVRINATVGTDGTALETRSLPMGNTDEQKKFATGDCIAISAGTQAAVTYTHNATANTWTPETGKYLKWETATMDFNAYYPAGKNDASMTTFTVPTDQSDATKIADADYMTCTATSVAKADNVSLSLTRRTARIVISGITFLDQYKTGYTVSDITVAGNTTGYTAADVLASGTVDVKSCKVDDGTANSKFYALLTPTAADATATFLTVTVKKDDTAAGEGETILTVKGIPATEAGMSYNYTLTVGKSMMNVGSVTVTDWTAGDVIGSADGNEAEETREPLTLTSSTAVTADMIKNYVSPSGKLIVTGTATEAQFAVVAQYCRENTAPVVTHLDFSGLSGITRLSPTSYNIYFNLTFQGSSLVTVNVPTTVTDITNAFTNCTSLTTVTGLDKVTTALGAFSGCASLKATPSMPLLTTLNNTFTSSSLTSYSSTVVTELVGQVFQYCTSLTTVDCANAAYLQNNLFDGCTQLQTIKLTASTFTYVRSFLGNDHIMHDPFTGIQNRDQVTLYLNANQSDNVVEEGGKWVWKPFTDFTNSGTNGYAEPVDLSGFAAVYCGDTKKY